MSRIQWRRDTAAAWTAANPILAEGEAGFETNTLKVKVGDGVTAWTGLAYLTAPGAELLVNKGAANGYASLDSNGKVPGSQLPNSIMTYEGLHNVSTNSPTLTDGTGDAGSVYRVSVAGTRNYGSGNITLDVGDYLIHSGTAWQKADTTDAVSSINGYTGAITLTKSDLGLGNVDNTSDAVKDAAATTLSNKTLSSPKINSILDTNGATLLSFTVQPSAANYVNVSNNAAGQPPYIQVSGTSTNINFVQYTKGTGSFIFRSNTTAGYAFVAAPSSGTGVNYLTATGSATGAAPTLSANGTDTDVSLNLVTKGAGTVQANGTNVLVNGGALGTPSSGTLTNCTGLPVTGIAATGTRDETTYLRGDGTWAASSGGISTGKAIAMAMVFG